MWEHVTTAIERVLVPPLTLVLDPVHRFLNALPPWTWKLAVCAWLTVGVLWGLLLPKSFIYEGAPSPSRWRDLRLWLVLLLIPYVWIYLLF